MNFASLAYNLMKQNQGESNKLDNLITHVPGVVTFADHKEKLPWTAKYTAVLLFADISGFTALCEKYGADQKTGIDQLTRILNAYLGELVQEIIAAGGDVLKFAGDALLSLWRVNKQSDLPSTVENVVKCCQVLQKQCGKWRTDGGVKLTVKLGVSAGDMSITFLGNDDSRFYVELGAAVSDVNIAEGFCKSGYIVLSPLAWSLCKSAGFDYEVMSDGKHVRIANNSGTGKKFSLKARRPPIPEDTKETLPPVENPNGLAPEEPPPNKSAEKLMTAEISKLTKLRNIVKTVTGLNLEAKLRLYVTPPVLKKLAEDQPLEYLSEMREVSVVFINLILEGEEDTTQLLQDVFDIIYMETKAVNGCLNKIFLFDKGCTFLVLFGLPGYKHERDSARALQCSTRMKKILDAVTGVSRVSIGVTTGATFCGVVGHKRRHEYTVIGRKVNMAARLMMHYHDKVTCDDDTFSLSRLSVSNFDILITKRMKGLRHVGTIREFKFHEDEETGLENTLPYFDYPILDREQHIELFTQQLNKLQHAEVDDALHQTQDVEKIQHRHRRHVVYVGAAGIGKTRLLDHFTVLAAKQNVRCLSFDLTTSDFNKSHFLARHILKVLLVTSGFSQEVDSEPLLLENLRQHNLIGYLHSFSDVIKVKLKSPESLTLLMTGEKESKGKRCEIYKILVQSCLDKVGPTVFILDNMRSCDVMSWDYLHVLADCPLALIVLGVRPKSIDEPPCPAAQMFFERRDIVTMDVENIDQRFMTGLACQILDVSRLHRDIDSLVRKLSHGIPSWTEQLLLDMYERKQLLIVIDDGKQSIGQSTVSPQNIFINKKPTKERRSSRVDRRKQNLVFDTSLQTSNAEAGTESTGEMLACLGYIPIKPGAVAKSSMNLNESTKRVAILADDVKIKDLGIPSSMSNMVVERLDSMRSLDQLIIKCCAVIGHPLSREIIKAVLPKTNMFKIKMSLKRLFKNGTFQCSANGLMVDRTQKKCWCIKNQKELEEPGGVVCNHFDFRNILLQETAYNTLMATHRTELHLKTSKYLLGTIESSRRYLPLYLYSSSLPKLDEQLPVDGNTEAIKKNLRVKDVFQDISNSGNLDPYIHHLNSANEPTRQKDLLFMIPVYARVKYQLEAAGEFRDVVDTLIEAASVAVVLEKSSDALHFLDQAESAVATLRGKDAKFRDTLAKYTEACIERLRGKAMYLSGRLKEAYHHLRKAGSILGLYQPTAKWQINFQMIKLKFSTFPSSFLLKSVGQYDHIRTIDRQLVEAGNCLSDLCRLHKEQNNHSLLLFDSRRLANLYQHTLPHPRQLLQSFIHLINYCRVKRWIEACHRLELELFATCVSLSRHLFTEDIRLLAKTFCHGASFWIDNGDVVKAINIGSVSLRLARSLEDAELCMKVLPLLVLACILNDRINEAIEYLLELKDLSGNHNSRCGRAWYFILAMELMLVSCHPIEPFCQCQMFASVYLRNYDVVEDENIPRFYAAMDMAVWYCRQCDWKNGQRWFDYWESYQPDQKILSAVLGRLKKLECMLISLWKAIDANIEQSVKRIEPFIGKEISQMKSVVKQVRGIQPRFYHLLSYFHMLKRQNSKARKYLMKSMKCAEKQDNKLDYKWALNSWSNWITPSSVDSQKYDWNTMVKTHLLEWKLIASNSEIIHNFPLPGKCSL